ncbi:MAG: hypothetical protein OJI67_10705 [Prosthecobacter sp.]|nr:hypothetical protein [Prosthecobacter sp.]
MKWILSLITLSALSSCTTKPYMVGSVNEQFYTRYRTPGASFKKKGEVRDYDYTWQQNLNGTARLPIAFRQNKAKVTPAPVPAPAAVPYTSSK